MPSARGMHRCEAASVIVEGRPACTLDVPHRLLMCPRHWGLVSPEAQQALWGSYRRVPGSNGRAVLTTKYRAAVRRCLTDVKVALDGTLTHNPSAWYADDATSTDEARKH